MSSTGSTAASARPAGSYVARHWRGELSLPRSYWLNGFVIGMVARIIFTFLLTFILITAASSGRANVGLGLAFLAAMAANIAIVIWQLVGVWRSAGHHAERGGKNFWAILARISVVLGVVGIIAIEAHNVQGLAAIMSGQY